MTVEQIIHNRYEISILQNGKEINHNVSYNKAYSDRYYWSPYIDKVGIIGDSFGKIVSLDSTNDEVIHTWTRETVPTFFNKTDKYSEYSCEVNFKVNVNNGSIIAINLLSGDVVVSETNLTDVNNKPIVLPINDQVDIHIRIYIFFTVAFGAIDFLSCMNPKWYPERNGIKGTAQPKSYHFTLFDASHMIFFGNSGREEELLKTNTSNLSEKGYLPQVFNTGLAITKSPIPKIGEVGDNLYYQGGILDFQKIPRTEQGLYINKTPAQSTWKGLIRAIVIPYIGLIDLTDTKIFNGDGIFRPKPIRRLRKNSEDKFVTGREDKVNIDKINSKEYDMIPCFIPNEYVKGDKSNLISMSKNGLYTATRVTPRRYRPATYKKRKTHDKTEIGKAFFSDINTNLAHARCQGFSQHIPLTENTYCGAESVIPCTYSSAEDMTLSGYGYLIDYSNEISANIANNGNYITLDYAVTGEYVWYSVSDGRTHKGIFPYILEYSYDGNIFEIACDFSKIKDNGENEYKPYTRVDFGPITAPIWRIRSEAEGLLMLRTSNTTHSDPYIAEVTGDNINGYDPLFIFVGRKNDFKYETDPNAPDVMQAKSGFQVTIPYLCHPNDSFYLSTRTEGEK